jgi:ABC-type multidrug transport system fused ATPase/permease subunit
MERGKVVEMGTHETLLAQGHHYARLHQMGLTSEPTS